MERWTAAEDLQLELWRLSDFGDYYAAAVIARQSVVCCRRIVIDNELGF